MQEEQNCINYTLNNFTRSHFIKHKYLLSEKSDKWIYFIPFLMLYAWQSNHLFNYYFDSVTKGTRFLLAATAVLSFVEFDVLLLLFLIWSVVLFFLSKEISWTLFLFFSDFGDGVGSSRTRFKSFSSKFSSLEDFGLEMVINCNLLGLGLPPSFKLRILISAGLQTPSLFNGMPEKSLFF